MNLWQDLRASFKAVFGPVGFVAALALAVFGGLYSPAATVQVGVIWIVVAAIIVVTALLTAWNKVETARRQARDRLPRVHGAFPANRGGTGGSITLLLGPSELFGFNVLTAIYYTEAMGNRAEIFERLIGVGWVSNVQQNRHIQITVLKSLRVMRSCGG